MRERSRANCGFCNQEFFNLNRKKYCSKDCYSKSMIKYRECKECKSQFIGRKEQKFCSEKCFGKDRKGIIFTESHKKNLSLSNIKPDGYSRIAAGYKIIKVNGKWIHEHHYIWIRDSDWHFIPQGFVVHHINKNKIDNRIENLACIPLDIHVKLHHHIGDIRGGIENFV